MKSYELKNVFVDHNRSRTKERNQKGINRENLRSNSQKKNVSPSKKSSKNASANEKIKKSIFSQLGNSIVHNNDSSVPYDVLKDYSNKENENIEFKKNGLNFSLEKNDYNSVFLPLNKMKNSINNSNNNNSNNLKVQSYHNRNGNSINASGEIMINNNNLVPVINYTNNNASENITFKIEEEQLYRYINITDLWLDLQNSTESKQGLSNLSKRYLSSLKDETQDINFTFEIFNNNSLSKAYSKACKLSLIIIIFNKFILSDYQYDNNLKVTLKKLFNSVSDIYINITEMFIITPLINKGKEVKMDIQEKFVKFTKANKINKKLYTVELCNLFMKMSDGSINSIKLFSNTYFKTGFFKPIHNIILDLIRNLDKLSVSKVVSMVADNIIFGFLIQTLPTNLTNKQIMFNPPSFNMMFQTPNPPFLPPTSETLYTLVLDLDETLVHFFFTPSGGSFLIRPRCFEFLKSLSTMYEICIFTAAMKDVNKPLIKYADSILDLIDKDYKIIKHRLYRNHTSIVGNGFVKVIILVIRDISKLGRDLSRVIIIDNLPENFRLQNNNGLAIRTWNEDMKDTQLSDFQKILTDIYVLKVPDVRNVIKRIREDVNKSKNQLNPYSTIDISKYL